MQAKINRTKITLYDIQCCIDVYNGIARKNKPEFINGKVKEIFG